MGDHRPIQTAEPDNEAIPPFRSNRVVLDDGRAVGLTEPVDAPETRSGPAGRDHPTNGRWMPAVPELLRSWTGVGVWLGAMTVVGLAAMMFSPSLSDPGGSPTAEADRAGEEAFGIGVGVGAGTELDNQRASRARTTGELTDDAVNGDPAARASGRSSGPSGGLDLDLGHRSNEDSIPATGPAPASPVTTSGAGVPIASTNEPTESTERLVAGNDDTSTGSVVSTTSTTRANSFPGSEPAITAPPATVEVETDDGGDGDSEGDPPGSGSVPPGSTSVPEPGTLPPPVTLPPSVTLPPAVPPTIGRPTTPPQPPVTVEPPTTRKSVPADTRPSPGNGQNRGRGRGADSSVGPPRPNGANGSNGRAVGRQR